MRVLVIGLNHKTSPIQIREKFYLHEKEQELLLSELKSEPGIAEAIVLSTCNRTEIFAHVLDAHREAELIQSKLFSVKNIRPTLKLKKHFYILDNELAIKHLFEVTTGLDSLILGEKQILGQVKHSVERSRKKGLLGKQFNVLSNLAIRAGKKAQNETDISAGGRSISWAAVAAAEKAFGSLEGKKILLMGAGKMSELAADILTSRRLAKTYVMNRTQENGAKLAKKFGGTAVGFLDIKEVLAEVDVGICAVDAPHYILDKEAVFPAMKNRDDRPLLLIDISIPRNIDPQINKTPNVKLIHIDDLDKVVQRNMQRREKAIAHVQAIIDVKFSDYHKKLCKMEDAHLIAVK